VEGHVSDTLLLAGCGGDSSGPARIEVEGSWAGNFTFSSGTQGSLTLTLQETDGTVSGTGTSPAPGDPTP
jgi:hypothetical protein